MKKIVSFIVMWVLSLSTLVMPVNAYVDAEMTEQESDALLQDILNLFKEECGDDMANCYVNDIDFNDGSLSEIEKAVTLLNTYGVTVFKNATEFMATKNIRRDEVAKMYVNFAKSSNSTLSRLKENMKPANQCNFKDSAKAWKDIQPLLIESCQYNLFQWSKGYFKPLDNITNGQAVIVLIRMLEWYKQETGVSHYAEKYMERADELGLLDWLNLTMKTVDQPATRWTIAKLLYRSEKLK